MNFQPSDKVVCVDDSIKSKSGAHWNPYFPDGYVKAGVVYTVHDVNDSNPVHIGLILTGLRCVCPTGKDVGWHYKRFRKLDEMRKESSIRNKKTKTENQNAKL